jgi:hypothetical protein
MGALGLIDPGLAVLIVIDGVVGTDADAFAAAVAGKRIDVIFGAGELFTGKAEQHHKSQQG